MTNSPSNTTLGNTTAGSGVTRSTTDGDTLSWVSTLTNAGALQSQATVTDVFAGSPVQHTFQGGSLQVPPGYTPQWSTDAGTTWLNSEPGAASTVNAVRSSGLVAPGPDPGAAFAVQPILAPFQLPSGVDGWDVSFYEKNIYVTPHHTTGRVYCFVKISGATCPGSPYPLGSQFISSGDSGPAIDRNAGVLWEAGFSQATTRAQLQCFNLIVPGPCATNAIDFGPTLTGVDGRNVVSETTLINGKLYFLYIGQNPGPAPDANRKNVLACLTISGTYCTGTGPDGLFTLNLGSWQANPADGTATSSVYHTAVWAQGTKLYLQNRELRVTCWDTLTDTSCPGSPIPWPVDLSQGTGPSDQFGLVPRVALGVENGFCAVRKTVPMVKCMDKDGAPATAPLNLGALFQNDTPLIAWHAAVAFGSRVYLPRHPAASMPCFDYQTDAPCAGFTNISLDKAYTVRGDPYHPECIWANSDVGRVVAFDVFTGAACGKDQRFAETPQSYYCAGAATVTGYGTLSLKGLSSADFATATVSITDANGAAIPGYTNLSLSPGNPTVPLAGIPYGPAVVIGGSTRNTTTLNVVLTFAGTIQSSSSWVATPPPTLNVTWHGPAIQPLCFKTAVPPTLCAPSAAGAVAVVTTGRLQDTTGTANLGPVTSSFDYQPAGSCTGEGTLKVCKVAGPGVAVGAGFTFTAGSSTFTVPAGPPPGGTCVVAPTRFAVGAIVVVKETVPPGVTVVSIDVAPSGRLVGSPNLATGTVNVRIGDGITEATYTDKRTGFLEICKRASGEGVTGNFTFFVDPGGIGPLVVPVGACSPAMEVGAGPVTITEPLAADTMLAGCSTIPANNQGPCLTGPQTSTVTVAPGDVSAQTVAFLVNRRKPVPCVNCGVDFNGDRRTDVAVFRPSNGAWYIQGQGATVWGVGGDIPVPADYDGDGRSDLAVFRPSNGVWYVNASAGGTTAAAWGTGADIPVPADYDGDGKADRAVFRPATGVWYVDRSGGGSTATAWGTNGDIPVPADYDGDGKADLAVYRPSNGVWYVEGQVATAWGASGDVPVPADYDADGKADVAVFRPSNGVWYVDQSAGATVAVAWGVSGDIPVPGDYDDDGDAGAGVAVFRPASSFWFIQGQAGTFWGTSGDIPLPLPNAIARFLV